CYLLSLEEIVQKEKGRRNLKARELLNDYKKAAEIERCSIEKTPIRIYNSNITGVRTFKGGMETINGGIFGVNFSEAIDDLPKKRDGKEEIAIIKKVNNKVNVDDNENLQDVLEDKSSEFEMDENQSNVNSNEEDGVESEEYEKEDQESNENEKETCVKVDKNAFRLAFEKTPESSKLKLTSGKVVEDILFNYVKDHDYEQLKMKALFNSEDWMELTKDHLGTPAVP
ncbi:11055_t:CDS:2, partial [Entrophospora sp. SA101]